MEYKSVALAATLLLALAGCGDTLGERTLSGAGIGALGAAVLGGNAASGAVVGGAAGAICSETNTCPDF
ncbi:MAG: hypothetical protein ACE5FS_03135 [Paracoccaceae bacterium]